MTEHQAPPQSEYDQRLFGGGLRRRLHMARFRWLERRTQGLQGSVIELGCNNGRSLSHYSFSPHAYLGLDAGETDVAAARRRYPQYRFEVSRSPADISGRFDLAVALETMEHIDRIDVAAYVEALSHSAPKLLVSVPVEIGITFAVKHLAKFVFHGEKPVYTAVQFANQTLGRSHMVPQHEHLGFDYRWLRREIERHYVIERVDALPFGLAPFCMQVAFEARSRNL